MDESTLDKIAEIICGDNCEQHPIYRSGPNLTDFFSRAKLSRFVHDGSTRQKWVLQCLKTCTREELASVIKRLASPREYGGDKKKIDKVLKSINEATYVEGFRVKIDGSEPKFEKVVVDYNLEEALEEFTPQPPPDFLAFGLDPSLGEILESRWFEAQQCIDAEAYLASIIIMGSLLEGLLLGICQRDLITANQCSSSPKDKKTGKVKYFNEWTLADMINVAHDVGWLDLDVKRFSHELRDFRNLVHPHKQMEMKAKPDGYTSKIAWQVVQAAINDIEKALKQS